MSNRFLRTTLAAALAVSAAACSDDADNGLGPTIELSDAEAAEVMEVIGTLALDGSFELPGQAAAMIASIRHPEVAFATVNVNQTLECPVSGTRHTTGNITANDEQTQFDATFTQTYSDCAAAAESGTVWTFNTAPSLNLTLSATSDPETESVTASMSFNGGFQVVSDDDRSGSCTIDLDWNLTASGTSETISASVSGSVCGKAVSQTVDITG